MNMRKLLIFVTGMALSAITAFAQPAPQWPEVKTEMKPGARWWWMGSAVDDANLNVLMKEYARTGIGTLEITPIYGVQGNEKNERSYLSQSWMDALKTTQTYGQSIGVDIDMNGGTGWPFGGPWVKNNESAGKLVTKSETKTSDGTIPLSFDVKSPEGNSPLSKVMAYRQDGDQQVVEVTQFVEGTTLSWLAPAGEWLLLAVYNGHTGQMVKRAAPGGEGLVLDHYDADAVKNYLAHFDERFAATGAQWPHSFFNDSYEVYGADWTPKMFAEFEKYRGYKLEEHMDQLLGLGKRKDTGNQVLADYRQTLSDMLLNNFTRQWTYWAHSHNVTTRNQGHGSPGNLIDFYASVDIPEIEGFGITDFKIRGLRTDAGFTSQNLSDLATLKYASSAAHVAGKRLVSSETFTWLAEHFRVSLSQMKPELDLMFLSGVNHIFFHGTTYSPTEAAWPGWKFYASVDMSPTNSIWRDAPWLMQYATRCQSFLQMGQPDNDILVYAPFVDAMHKNTGANASRLQLFDINKLSQMMPSMVTAVNNIGAAGLDCDFISDELLLTTTFVNGQLQTAAGTRYKALVVPVSTNIPEPTKQHLDDLKALGAVIVYDNTAAGIASLNIAGEQMRTDLGLRTIRRANEVGYHYFIANLSSEDISGWTSLSVPFAEVLHYNPLTGRISAAAVENDRVWLSLRSGESMILQTINQGVERGLIPQSTDQPFVEMAGIPIHSKWTLTFSDSTYSATPAQTYTLDTLSTWEHLDATTSPVMGTGVYETVFNVSPSLLAMANSGMCLDLGDVRESARVYVNNIFAGCAWSAPFKLDVTGMLHEGDNTLRIEVTNLPANRIRQMDIDGTQWRIFKDVNILDIVNGNTSQQGVTYNDWELVPSGLHSLVKLVPLRRLSDELSSRLISFVPNLTDSSPRLYHPCYQLTTPTGLPISQLEVTTTDGKAFSAYTLSDDHSQLVVMGDADGYILLKATDSAGNKSETYLTGKGLYLQQTAIDFTSDEAPLCGWQVMTKTAAIQGFDVTCNWRRAPGQNATKEAVLADGVTAQSESAIYYFYYPGYGMAVGDHAQLIMPAEAGDVALLSYLVGSAEKATYNPTDSLLLSTRCEEGIQAIVMPLISRKDFYLYRSLQVFRPYNSSLGVSPVVLSPAMETGSFYTLQGIRVSHPQRGLYIRNGRKIVVR